MVFDFIKLKIDVLGRYDDSKLLRNVAVELAMGLMKKELELEENMILYLCVGHTADSVCALM